MIKCQRQCASQMRLAGYVSAKKKRLCNSCSKQLQQTAAFLTGDCKRQLCTELNAEELQVKVMTDPECIEMLEQEKWERQKRRQERELEEKQKKREKHDSQNIKQALEDYRRRLLA